MSLIERREIRIGFIGGLNPGPVPTHLYARCHATEGRVEHEYVRADIHAGAVEALREIASFHEHGKGSAITPAVLAKKAQRALDNLHPGGQ